MTTSFKFFADSALTIENTSAARATFVFNSDGSIAYADTILYFGSNAVSTTARDAASPGTAQIAVTPTDTVGGSGLVAADIKLALTAGGLPGATGGAALNIGTQVLSGVVNAIPIYIRMTPSTFVAGTYDDLQLQTQNLQES